MYEPITYSLLQSKKFYRESLDAVKEYFGDNNVPLEENAALLLVEKRFDFQWAAGWLLTESDWWEHYIFSLPHWTNFNRIRDVAWDDYLKSKPECKKEALEKYTLIKNKAMLEYRKVMAIDFMNVYKKGITK